ncbi:hypothetical protein ASD11_09170 [Aeromicrobium sp. Root495]|uniref:MCE family protein n=1 Tax=Aeromicrobium sp. Root495 TaxID=1736550 RepID=UPI0006F32825|nr:MCE family protein [Aeromicrobium sp. Root495]KQY59703.1 hypothetical protein ASD11_09170 [Aeromicrobium sp. Root495]
MIDASLIDRDLASRGVLVRRGIVLLLVLALGGALLVATGRGAFSDDVTVHAQLDDVGGALVPGSDVKVDGNVVGRVARIGAADGGVRLDLRVKSDQADAISGSLRARVLPASVFGTTYVDLVRTGADGAGTLRAGQVIAQDTTSRTVELQDALDSTDRLLTSVRPAELSTTLGALAQALDGRGEQLGSTLEAVDSYLARLQPRLPLVREDLRLLARNLDTLADVAPDLLDATKDALVTARTITAERQQLTRLIGGSADLVGEAGAAATTLQEPFVKAVDQSAFVVNTMFEERKGFPASLLAFTRFAAKQATTFDDGSYMSTNVFIKTGDDAPYTAADCPRYGSAAGPNCGAGAPAGTGAAPRAEAAGDAALVAELRSVLDDLESARDGGSNGVGELLARPFLEKGSR